MFPDRMKALRQETGLSREKVGAALGVSTTLVYKWETGQCEPDIGHLLRLCELFHVSMDDLCCNYRPEDEPVRVMTRAIARMSAEERSELLGLSQRLYASAFAPPAPVKPRRTRRKKEAPTDEAAP